MVFFFTIVPQAVGVVPPSCLLLLCVIQLLHNQRGRVKIRLSIPRIYKTDLLADIWTQVCFGHKSNIHFLYDILTSVIQKVTILKRKRS